MILYPTDGKKFRCALSENSPHLEFWSKTLSKINKWKICDSHTGAQRHYHKFINGWQLTLRAVMLLWRNLNDKGLTFLCLRNLNQDPIENLFCQIRQHGISNTNPTCHQFVSALKTVVINNFSVPLTRGNNCENDYCKSLGDIASFLIKKCSEFDIVEDSDNFSNNFEDEEFINDAETQCEVEDNYASAYVAGYILKKISIPDCHLCQKNLFCSDITEKHLFIQFKEFGNNSNLTYPSTEIINLVEQIHVQFYTFLDKHGHEQNIEARFKTSFSKFLKSHEFCNLHNPEIQILDICSRLVVYKYLKNKKNQ